VASPQEDDFLAQLQATFRIEAQEHLRAMSAGLLELENTADPAVQRALIENVFRDAHSLKGAARAVNLAPLETLCQAIEGLCAALKRGEIQPGRAIFDALHRALDALEAALGSQAGGGADYAAVSDALAQLARAHSPGAPVSLGAAPAMAPPAPAAIIPPRAAPVAEKPVVGETVRIARAKLDALLLQTEELLAVKLALRQRATDLYSLGRLGAPWRKSWTRLAPDVRALRQTVAPEQTAAAVDPHAVSVVRVLDFLESNRTCFTALEGRLNDLARVVEQDAHAVGTLVDGLLDDMKKAVMMPCTALLELLPRLVRDVAHEQNKNIALVMDGGGVEIDRRILEEMKDPLIHLLRNGIDHGIETPDRRAAGGKPDQGTITVSIAQIDSRNVEIMVGDDGAGIDMAGVKEAAVDRNIIAADAAGTLTDAQALALIFESEVSTSPRVTKVSGRGLGLAIVREKVEKLGGRVTVETCPGRGTTFHILLPLTLATVRGILVRVAGRLFILPLAGVERVVRIRRDAVKTVEGRETVLYGGRPIALVWLADVLELHRPPAADPERPLFPAVVLVWADKHIAFGVDEVLQEQEVLTKSLGRQLQRVRNISGATVLGSGVVVPILNAADLLKSALKGAAVRPGSLVAEKGAVPRRRILVVEDSITARLLLKNILESAGYQVQTAVDGAEAWALLQHTPFDLVVSDIEMPHLDGFALTAKIRADKQRAALPVVLVTALEAPAHKERGFDAGANAYIVKSSFDQSNLLETVRRFI